MNGVIRSIKVSDKDWRQWRRAGMKLGKNRSEFIRLACANLAEELLASKGAADG